MSSCLAEVRRRLTLNVQGDAVAEDLVVVDGDAGQRLLVRFSAGNQNVVALNGERSVWVPDLSGRGFSRNARLPPDHVSDTQTGYRLLDLMAFNA